MKRQSCSVNRFSNILNLLIIFERLLYITSSDSVFTVLVNLLGRNSVRGFGSVSVLNLYCSLSPAFCMARWSQRSSVSVREAVENFLV